MRRNYHKTFIWSLKVYVSRHDSIIEHATSAASSWEMTGQGIITKLSIESQNAPKLLILLGKCSVAIKVFEFPKLLMKNTKNTK